jgi:large subunit ribosomal protein L25
LPAVVYGDGKEPVSISISEWELEQHVKAHHRVFQLDIAGQAQAALLQEVTWHNTTDRPVHVDFKRIDLTKPIETEVEVTLVGHPVGLGKGGTLMKDHMKVMVRCLPTAIPDSIEHDVSSLEIDQYLTAGEQKLPAGCDPCVSAEDARLPRRQARRAGSRSGSGAAAAAAADAKAATPRRRTPRTPRPRRSDRGEGQVLAAELLSGHLGLVDWPLLSPP